MVAIRLQRQKAVERIGLLGWAVDDTAKTKDKYFEEFLSNLLSLWKDSWFPDFCSLPRASSAVI